MEPEEPGKKGEEVGVVVNLAEWTGSQAQLAPHAPERTELKVALGTNTGH